MPPRPGHRPLIEEVRQAVLPAVHAAPGSSRPRRLRVLAIAGCIALLLIVMLTSALSQRRSVDASWGIGPQNHLELRSSGLADLQPLLGQTLAWVQAPGQSKVWVDARVLYPAGQWNTSSEQRELTLGTQRSLAAAFAAPLIELGFESGDSVTVTPHRVGVRALGLGYWLLMGLAAALFATSCAVLVTRPIRANQLFVLMSFGHVASLVFLAAMSTGDLTVPLGFMRWDQPARLVTDMITVATLVQVMVLYPVPQAGKQWLASLSWGVTIVVGTLVLAFAQANWWLARITVGVLGVLALSLSFSAQRSSTHPLCGFFKRVGMVILGIWGLLTVGVAASATNPGPIAYVAAAGSVLWSVFFALLLLLMPYLARSRQIVREFALLAAITTAATALNLLFVSIFGMDTLTALTLTVLSALIGYTLARQWLLDQSIGRVAASSDRVFAQIYATLSAEEALRRSPAELARELLTEIFEARSAQVVAWRHSRARVARDGATLTVPLPGSSDVVGAAGAFDAVELREAQGGRRLFTLEDARWAERVLTQFNAALTVQRAREQGRSEERQRLAQDLHDDIGARLLTLLYKAPSRDIEDYIRNTITDLKTLTRGLASGSHHLIDAAAEWRTDAGRRLEVAQVELDWSLHTDRDIELTVVQWSALTRVLRELVSNVIAHAQASTVWIRLHLEGQRLMMSVEDDGIGGSPGQWPHGLGLGGVRKRIKQMGGDVQWMVGRHGGIRCEIHVQDFSPDEPTAPAGTALH